MSEFIGEKKIKETVETGETTPGGELILKVTYQDDTEERFSKVMYDKIASDKKCSLEELRDKRCRPVVEVLLTALREFGVKLSELQYISALLNNSLDHSKNAALNELWGQWQPKPLAPDEVSLLTVDRVLRHVGADKTK